jgi:hypothetical protein
MNLRCANGCVRDTSRPFERHLEPGRKCGNLASYDRLGGSRYCGAILVLDSEFPEVGRRLFKLLPSGKIEGREVFNFRPGGAGEVLYHFTLFDAKGQQIRKASGSTTYKRWRQWAKTAQIAADTAKGQDGLD